MIVYVHTEPDKWLNYFDKIQGLVFVVSLASYDQKCPDQSENAMLQSLHCWEQVCDNQQFGEYTPIMLLFNKWDLFEKKIVNVPITVTFPHYQGPIANAQKAYEFIRLQFMSKVNGNYKIKNPNKYRYHCLGPTSAIGTDNAKQAFDDIHDMLIRSRLAKTGFVGDDIWLRRI